MREETKYLKLKMKVGILIPTIEKLKGLEGTTMNKLNLYTNKLNKLHEMEKFLETCKY